MIEVYCSSVIAAPAKRVWALVRDFNSMPEWNFTMVSSAIENGPADRIGCRRVLIFEDGGIWTHELTGLSDAEMTIAYTIVGAPPEAKLSLRNYQATIRVEPADGGGHCKVTWRAAMESDEPDTVRERAEAVFQAGFAGLKRKFRG